MTDRSNPPSDEVMGKVVAKWKPVFGYEGYLEVSECGKVRSLDRTVWNGKVYRVCKGKLLSTRPGSHGYPMAHIMIDGVRTSHLVHRLVAEAFIPNPNELPQVNHKDGVKDNNHAENLEWCTASQNTRHAVQHGLAIPNKTRRKLTEPDVRGVRRLHAEGMSQSSIATKYGVSPSTIHDVIRGNTWKYVY